MSFAVKLDKTIQLVTKYTEYEARGWDQLSLLYFISALYTFCDYAYINNYTGF